MQHAGGRRNVGHGLEYHPSGIFENVDFKTVVALAYEGSMQQDGQKKREVFLGDVNPLVRSSEKDSAEDNVSRNTLAVVRKRDEDKNSAMDVQPDHAVDAPIEDK